LHYFGVHQGCVGFCIGECDRNGWRGVKEEVLKKWAKAPEGVDRQRDQYHVLGKDIANYFVANGRNASAWFFFVIASKFLRSCFWRCELVFADKMLVTLLEVGSKEGQGAILLMVISNPIVV
jgi:hypothetical protein